MKTIPPTAQSTLHLIARILIGAMFFLHGGQKLFGWFAEGKTVPLLGMLGAAGLIEVIVGVLITFGLLTRLSALIGGLQMIAAYGIAHAPKGLIPLANGGELALMYLAGFLLLLVHGAGRWSLDHAFGIERKD